MDMNQQGGTIYELDSTEIAMLEDLANNYHTKAGTISRGILEYGYGYHYCDCLYYSDSSGLKSSNTFYDQSKKQTGLSIDANPNPAKNWVAFDYSLPSYMEEAIIDISDVRGNSVASFELKQSKGQQVWDIRKIKPGIYIYTLKTGSSKQSGKLLIN